MSRIIGCRDLHIAELLTDPATGKPTYGTPKRVPSLISVSVSDTVEQVNFYSDDTVEQTSSKTSSKTVTIELGYLSNELESEITGKTFGTDGVLIQGASDAPKELALLFRAPKSKNGDFRYVCLYKGTLNRTENQYDTQEDIVESANITLTGTFIPCLSNGRMSAVADSEDSDGTVISGWFTSVYTA